jgi:hypothetical protein
MTYFFYRCEGACNPAAEFKLHELVSDLGASAEAPVAAANFAF